jgi:hypothetical protein
MLSFTTFLAVLFAAGQLISLVHGHMDMKSPTPFRSKFIIPNAPNTDFSMTSPLLEDGSDFPCKGYQNDDLANVATLTAGSNLAVEYISRPTILTVDLTDQLHTTAAPVNFRYRTMVEKTGSLFILLWEVVRSVQITPFPSQQVFRRQIEPFLHGAGKITLAIGITQAYFANLVNFT